MRLPLLYKRTRLLNILHSIYLADAHSQMVEGEKQVLAKHAKDRTKALEIGTYMGVSANIIAKALGSNGKLFCVDPFLPKRNGVNAGKSIAVRDLKRNGLLHKVAFLEGFSTTKNIIESIPLDLDFIFIDGDHSYEGLANDWEIVHQKLTKGGIVCLHDTMIPVNEEFRKFGSVKYFQDVVSKDSEFELIDSCHSMTVLKRK